MIGQAVPDKHDGGPLQCQAQPDLRTLVLRTIRHRYCAQYGPSAEAFLLGADSEPVGPKAAARGRWLTAESKGLG